MYFGEDKIAEIDSCGNFLQSKIYSTLIFAFTVVVKTVSFCILGFVEKKLRMHRTSLSSKLPHPQSIPPRRLVCFVGERGERQMKWKGGEEAVKKTPMPESSAH